MSGLLTQLELVQALKYGLVVLAVTYLCSLVYNVFLHPLRNIPGPLLARMTGIPSFYHALKGDRHVWLWQLFQVYGERIRPDPNTVVFCDPVANKDIYNNKANVQRSNFYAAWSRNKHDAHTMNTVDFAKHAHKRRLLSGLFTEKMVRATAEFIYRHVDRWNELMVSESNDWSDSIDLSETIETLVFDISGDLVFGRSFEIKEPGENPLKVVPHTTIAFMKFFYPLSRSPILAVILWLKPRGLDWLLESLSPPEVRHFFQFVHDSVSERIKLQEAQREKDESEQRQDMFHFLYEAKDPDTGLRAHDDGALRAEASLLVLAATDTSATSMTCTMFYLSLPSQAHRLAKLIAEIRSTFNSPNEIVYGPKLNSCVYMKAAIEEGMRLGPASGSELSRLVRKGGITIKGEFYPEGTIVGTSGFTNGRNEQVYHDCNTYRPERWIVDEAAGVTAEDVARARSNYFPFAAGPGSCLGKSLAMLQMQVTIGRTLWRYDVRRSPGSTVGGGSPDLGWGQRNTNDWCFADAFTAIHHGPELQFRKRQL